MLRNRFRILLAALSACVLLATPARAARIKDICSIEGVRDNSLVGYGLVVGLEGTGDDDGTQFTRQSLVSFMRRNNIHLDLDDVEVENVAAVLVTAQLPAFATQGTKIDVSVASIGDAEDLHGGTLVATALRPAGADPNAPGNVYAVAQGPLSTGGFSAEGNQASVVKNHPTTALIPNGATVEREVRTQFATKPEITLQLRNPDFTTASRIERMINSALGEGVAKARNAASVAVTMPGGGVEERVRFISEIETLEVSPDTPARVVYNERTGNIVMGADVRISKAIIAHGNLIFEKTELPNEFAAVTTGPYGERTVVEASAARTEINVREERGEFQVLEEGVTIGEVAKGLNALGVTSRDIIAILQALKNCGALQAELAPM